MGNINDCFHILKMTLELTSTDVFHACLWGGFFLSSFHNLTGYCFSFFFFPDLYYQTPPLEAYRESIFLIKVVGSIPVR